VIAISIAVLGGCAHASPKKVHNTAYITGSVTKNIVEESHKIYSKNLNKKVDECEESATSEAGFDACLGPFAKNEAVVTALDLYKKSAEILFDALKDPGTPKEQLENLRRSVIDLANGLLDLLPEGSKAKEQVRSILGR